MNAKLMLSVTTCILALGCQAQDLSYSLLDSPDSKPAPRVDGAITYDPVDQQVLLFGGRDGISRSDLWSYSLLQKRWVEIQSSGAPPPARFGHTVVFDARRRRLVVFGGQASGFFSDVWALDIASKSWTRLSVDGAGPSRRYGHSAIYDTARDRMVISHGFTNSGRFDDTWAFDFATNSWRDISPAGTRPLRRCLHHASYDEGRGRMYLYGGCSSGFGPCPQGDLWSFDLALNRWTQLTPQNSPPPRQQYGMAFDAMRDKLIVFGGDGNGLLSDTWEFDPGSGVWQPTAITGAPPVARNRQESVYASDRGVIFSFGGSTESELTNELWSLEPSVRSASPKIFPGGILNAFSATGDAVAPGQIVSLYGEGLGPTAGVAFGFDPQTGKLPTSGIGVSVTWNDILSPIFYAQSGQTNVQVPYELEGSTEARLRLTVNGQVTTITMVPVKPTMPGLFPQVWNQDGSLNSPDNPASVGSLIVLYATGQGVTNPRSQTGSYPEGSYPEPVAATALSIGGHEANILFRGQAPGTAGVMQINARVPEEVARGTSAPIVLSVGGASTQSGIFVAVR
ncbi:MAG: kelch repeat-containing protein [Bryobacteraceae bacterium]